MHNVDIQYPLATVCDDLRTSCEEIYS